MPVAVAVDDGRPAVLNAGFAGNHQMARAMFGDSADRLIAHGFDVGVLRPYMGMDGRNYFTLNSGTPEAKVFTTNAPATLTWDAWKIFDDTVIRAVRDRLRAFADIRGAGLEYNIPNGMAHTVLQYQTATDVGPATLSMDPIRRGEADVGIKDVGFLPLPCAHKDFDFSARQIAVSGQGRIPMPVDTGTAESAARKVAELIEQLTTGVAPSFSYGGGTIWGYVTFPQRATKTDMTVPTGANGGTTVTEILALRQLLINNKHYGPYMLYMNGQWAQFLDTDFSTTKGDKTLRERLMAIDGIMDVRVLDYLPTTKYDVLLVEMTAETVRAVIGMEIQTIQWESMGGLMKHFKVICINIPQLRPDTAGNSGVAHGRTP
jgi:hypothetical protein